MMSTPARSRAWRALITRLEAGVVDERVRSDLASGAAGRNVPVLGITGTGGSGKSSLTDELIRRIRLDQDDKVRVAVVAIDPTRRRGGGALLGDRIRMNAIDTPQVYFRSLATRSTQTEVPDCLPSIIHAATAWGADLVIVETPGIGQGDAAIVPVSDVSLYVMTPEFGASSQLEKIDMLDFADAVAINKFERRGAADAQRDVSRQMIRNREAFDRSPEDMPVFGTVASRFNDDGVTALYQHLRVLLGEHGLRTEEGTLVPVVGRASTGLGQVVPESRVRYLADIAESVRSYHRRTAELAETVRLQQQLEATADLLVENGLDADDVGDLAASNARMIDPDTADLLAAWPDRADALSGPERPARESLAGTPVPRVALPRYSDRGDLLRFLRSENLPGSFPFTAGVFPFRREDEDPARMFAGEGGPARTNHRFHLLAEGQRSTRLSTAFDSVTLYGFDPAERPDIYGKVGNSGVSIATLDDMEVLYSGFDLCDPSTSVSMTINGPAPTILAMFLNTAIDQRIDRFADENGRPPTEAEAADLREWVLANVRGTVQADILKEDQGQNTCIFSTEFSLGMMGDIAEWFVDHRVRNFYSVSISGYHIAEAGANPISQLAFTLSNGFTYVESYLARGLDIDDFAPNLSFFFSNGMDPEYTVLGRVARRIWSIAMRDRYGANERSQKLKYHVQTAGRSLHAQEMSFNDIRTTLQALCAIYDNANSLHTNAYDEAVTTPTAESVRRALAIQLIINREWGLAMNDNPLQGSFIVEELTELVEERGAGRARSDQRARRCPRRHGDRLPAGSHPGRVDAVRAPQARRIAPDHRGEHLPRPRCRRRRRSWSWPAPTMPRSRTRSSGCATSRSATRRSVRPPSERLRDAALAGDNLFDVLMDVVRCCSLGEITDTLFEVGGRYRRNV